MTENGDDRRKNKDKRNFFRKYEKRMKENGDANTGGTRRKKVRERRQKRGIKETQERGESK